MIFHGLVGVWVVGRGGGYVSLAHFVLWFTKVSGGVGGAIWQTISGICSVLAISFHLLGIGLCSYGCVFMVYAYYLYSMIFCSRFGS